MSRNVDVVRRAIEANSSEELAARTEEHRAALRAELWHPSCEYTSVVAALEPATYRGLDGIRRYEEDLAKRWSEWSTEVEEVREIGPDSVLATIRFRAVGKDSGAPVDARLGGLCVLSEGRLLRGQAYPTLEQAVEAAGLTE